MPDHDEDETEKQRLARNVNELLGELRVAQTGVQILFGFLLAVAFTPLFRKASGFEQGLHLAAVLLAVLATAMLSAPAAWHRVLFRSGRRHEILRYGNRLVLVGLVCIALAVTATIALMVKVIFGLVPMIVIATLVALVFATAWFFAPLRLR
ncbi:hypothetical protein H0B56_02570 [Haloechinothrix sp. YIM 98757]|uniref:Sodium:proton antiporter n=1 Tax=Haloechinothrix aidingensis TaxID=2752311 RepID=A0A838A849_9PSEU|nr:hypothetical protein [Haloechinothrix aidingensis]